MLLPFYNDKCIEAGLDEAGRGCLAGPVVAAAVVLPNGYDNAMLNDSKQLDKLSRHELAEIIKAEASAFAIGICSQTEIDEINILWASVKAMHKAVTLLEVKPEHLLVDGNRFKPYFGIPHTCVIKGDAKYQSIAAASILAKTYRDDLMEKYAERYPQYGWEQNAGYPTPKHRAAIKEFGITDLHRKTFRLLKD
ncbi:ribonuclease HII [Jiulongibacter sediminis]|jgi:ribonuclease HII|uniref:ribonuclease HII n=1 Tax=Jiulongibacter sediminis TaxID=1605367 RepID=UPI0026EE413B|nr:ribonuclease HII [Jiulongibacter sediminis]